jgi:DNA-binding transcriptional ArsR family regulator
LTPLPQRILQVLNEHGPSYAAALADELDAPDAAVSQALRSLARRGLVRRDGRDGRRVMFSAVAGARPRVPLWGLPARIWQHLATNGPSYASMIARELDVSDPGLVGTALRSLQRRGCVARAGLADVGRFTVGKPVLWAALEHPGHQPGSPVEPEVESRDREQRAQERPVDSRYSALDIDIALSRAADPDVEIEALMSDNQSFV